MPLERSEKGMEYFMEKLEFYKCETCGSVKVDILTDLEDCCNTDMIMMVPNTVDLSLIHI